MTLVMSFLNCISHAGVLSASLTLSVFYLLTFLFSCQVLVFISLALILLYLPQLVLCQVCLVNNLLTSSEVLSVLNQLHLSG